MIKRVLLSLLLLLIASFFIFTLLYILPGSAAEVLLGEGANSEEVEHLKGLLSLDKGLISSYFSFLLAFLKGDFGLSYINNTPVSALVLTHLLPTLELTSLATLSLVLVFIPLSLIAEEKKGGKKLMLLHISLSLSLPSFLFSLFFMLLFAVILPLFPVAGYKPLALGFFTHLKYLVLPSLVLAITYSGLLMQITYTSIKDKRQESYYIFAKARGLGKNSIRIKYLLLTSLAPILSSFSQSLIGLLSGAAIVETIFNIPGLGSLLVSSVLKRDYPTALAVVLLITVFSLSISLITDLIIHSLEEKKGGCNESW